MNEYKTITVKTMEELLEALKEIRQWEDEIFLDEEFRKGNVLRYQVQDYGKRSIPEGKRLEEEYFFISVDRKTPSGWKQIGIKIPTNFNREDE